jgi:radical SAM superfamily enzyme YgiQ (UPF0313 family)
MVSGVPGDALEPLVFAILAGLTPPDVERVLYDDRIENIPFEEPTDLVVLSVDTFTAKRAYQIAANYHHRGVPVVMGGCHPTLQPEETLQFASSIVIGDAEDVWTDVIEDAGKGNLRRIYKSRYPSLDGMRPDRSIFKSKRYMPMMLVQFGRGCRFACDFCSIHAFYGNNTRQRPVHQLVEEIEQVEPEYVFFTDDNLFVNVSSARKLSSALKPLGIRWTCQISLDVAADKELVQLMARSGCMSVLVGFESLIEENLRQMRKSWNRTYGTYEELIKVFHGQGIMVYGTFIFGYDHDTVDSFELSLDFALRTKLFLANFNPLAPTPGTTLYERLRQEKRLIYDPWWLHPDYRYGESMFHPRQMTAQQLADGCYWVRTQFNTYSCILGRARDFQANSHNLKNASIYLTANLINRREIHRKQGLPLGDESQLKPLFESQRS